MDQPTPQEDRQISVHAILQNNEDQGKDKEMPYHHIDRFRKYS